MYANVNGNQAEPEIEEAYCRYLAFLGSADAQRESDVQRLSADAKRMLEHHRLWGIDDFGMLSHHDGL